MLYLLSKWARLRHTAPVESPIYVNHNSKLEGAIHPGSQRTTRVVATTTSQYASAFPLVNAGYRSRPTHAFHVDLLRWQRHTLLTSRPHAYSGTRTARNNQALH